VEGLAIATHTPAFSIQVKGNLKRKRIYEMTSSNIPADCLVKPFEANGKPTAGGLQP
jgi:hypothetical protein